MKNFIKTLAAFSLSMLASFAIAGEMLPYDQAKFDQWAVEGKPAIVAVKADWCTTCKAQKPIVSELIHAKEYQDVSLLLIDFDAQKPLVKKYKVAMQSTLIAFKGGKEVDRSVGDTSQDGITALFNKALN